MLINQIKAHYIFFNTLFPINNMTKNLTNRVTTNIKLENNLSQKYNIKISDNKKKIFKTQEKE